jgi:phosphopantothenoylcysteine decarboxylase/phosphopantothenate--cysteine ligase
LPPRPNIEGSDIGADNIQVDSWPVMTKEQVATELVARIAKAMGKTS